MTIQPSRTDPSEIDKCIYTVNIWNMSELMHVRVRFLWNPTKQGGLKKKNPQ